MLRGGEQLGAIVLVVILVSLLTLFLLLWLRLPAVNKVRVFPLLHMDRTM